MAEGTLRDHVVSVRLSDFEHEHLRELAAVHGKDRSTLLRELILSAPLWSVRIIEPVDERSPEETARRRAANEWSDWLRRLIAEHGGP